MEKTGELYSLCFNSVCMVLAAVPSPSYTLLEFFTCFILQHISKTPEWISPIFRPSHTWSVIQLLFCPFTRLQCCLPAGCWASFLLWLAHSSWYVTTLCLVILEPCSQVKQLCQWCPVLPWCSPRLLCLMVKSGTRTVCLWCLLLCQLCSQEVVVSNSGGYYGVKGKVLMDI